MDCIHNLRNRSSNRIRSIRVRSYRFRSFQTCILSRIRRCCIRNRNLCHHCCSQRCSISSLKFRLQPTSPDILANNHRNHRGLPHTHLSINQRYKPHRQPCSANNRRYTHPLQRTHNHLHHSHAQQYYRVYHNMSRRSNSCHIQDHRNRRHHTCRSRCYSPHLSSRHQSMHPSTHYHSHPH
jgi:hypothetical protein